jgi:hypothetical protein
VIKWKKAYAGPATGRDIKTMYFKKKVKGMLIETLL